MLFQKRGCMYLRSLKERAVRHLDQPAEQHGSIHLQQLLDSLFALCYNISLLVV